MSDDDKGLSRVEFDPDLISRGTKELVPIRDACVLDFMPRIIGAAIMSDPLLRVNVYREGGRQGSLSDLQHVYLSIADEELSQGNLPDAIEAYKRSLMKATIFIAGMQAISSDILLNKEEKGKLNLDKTFGATEKAIIATITSGGSMGISQSEYDDFVRDVRTTRNQARDLMSDFDEMQRTYHPVTTAPAQDLEKMGMLVELYKKMQDYESASYIAKKIGDTQTVQQLESLIANSPQDKLEWTRKLDKIKDND